MQCVCGRGGDSLVQPGEGSPILPCLHILSSLSREGRRERREGREGEKGGEGTGGEGRRERRQGREGGRTGREEGKGKGETEITFLRSMYVCTLYSVMSCI